MDLTQTEETYPFGNEGPVPFFPPVCLKSHWDPTERLRHILPELRPGEMTAPLPLDFRPYTKVCLNYTTSGPAEMPETPTSNIVYPPGGEFYPPGRYAAAIDKESALRRLDRPLGTCDGDQYMPNEGGDMFRTNTLVPDRKKPETRFIQELAYPQALMRAGPYPCREEADQLNWSKSDRPFFNATKQERYVPEWKNRKNPISK